MRRVLPSGTDTPSDHAGHETLVNVGSPRESFASIMHSAERFRRECDDAGANDRSSHSGPLTALRLQ